MLANVVYTGGASYTVNGLCFKRGRAVKVSDAALIERLRAAPHFSVSEIKEVEKSVPAAPKAARAEDPDAPVKVPSTRKRRSRPPKKSKPAKQKAPAAAELDLEAEE
jgi:hypothetical protein